MGRRDRALAWLYERTGGRLGGSFGGHPVLLLTTRGRRTGLPRRTPVQYESVEGDLMLVASAGGAPSPPAWWRNIEADGRVSVQIKGRVVAAQAETLGAAERAHVWPLLCRRNRALERVQARARRELPVVRLRLEAGS